MRPDITEGATFPDYELPDQNGERRKLSDLQGIDPLIVMLGRGSYWPKDRQQLHGLVAFYPQLPVGYANLVTITTDDRLSSNELRQGVGAQWTFLYDERATIRDDLDIEEYTDPKHRPMIPHTFVLGPGLKIHKLYNGYWYWGRPSTAELHADLRELTKQIRPDYAIDTPELRAKWERGDKSGFYPYGESQE